MYKNIKFNTHPDAWINLYIKTVTNIFHFNGLLSSITSISCYSLFYPDISQKEKNSLHV